MWNISPYCFGSSNLQLNIPFVYKIFAITLFEIGQFLNSLSVFIDTVDSKGSRSVPNSINYNELPN